MISKEETTKILKQFSKECYKFWIHSGKTETEAIAFAKRDILNTNYNPYEPKGDKLDASVKTDFLKHFEAYLE